MSVVIFGVFLWIIICIIPNASIQKGESPREYYARKSSYSNCGRVMAKRQLRRLFR